MGRSYSPPKLARFFEPQCITVSEIERDTGENNGRKAGLFIPPCIRRPVWGVPVGISAPPLVWKN